MLRLLIAWHVLTSAARASFKSLLAGQRFQPDAIQHLVAVLEQPGVGAVSGSLELPSTNGSSSPLMGRYWALERWLRRCEARVHSSVGVSGSIWATRKSFWSPLPADLILDDLYTPMRIALEGHRVAFADAARAVETRHSQVGHEYRRKSAHADGGGPFVRQAADGARATPQFEPSRADAA